MTILKKNRERAKRWFLLYGDECYAVTRFCYFAFLQCTVFRLAHHTVEYYLKAFLGASIELENLKKMGHHLDSLATQFEAHGGVLDEFRSIVKYIDLFERLRYPRMESFSHVAWGLPYKDFFTRFPGKMTERVACFNLDDFDALVFQIRSQIAVGLPWASSSELSRDSLFRDNKAFTEEDGPSKGRRVRPERMKDAER